MLDLPPPRIAGLLRRASRVGNLRRVRQLPFTPPDLRWHPGRAEVAFVRLSHPRANAVWRGAQSRDRSADGRGHREDPAVGARAAFDLWHRQGTHPDRKSTRLNSSHLGISYAV